MSIELMLNAVNLAFVTFGYYLNDVNGAVIVLLLLLWRQQKRLWVWRL